MQILLGQQISDHQQCLKRSLFQVAELMRAADDLISKMGKTKTSLSQATVEEQNEEILQQRGMKMICDETSCVIVPLAAASNTVHGPTGNQKIADFKLPMRNEYCHSSWPANPEILFRSSRVMSKTS